MTPEQWARVKEVFHAALAQEPDSRSSFVAEATSGDAAVRAEVDRLLEADLHAGDFIEQPAASAALTGRVIGHYEIGRLVGSGGMGRVYAARDTELGRDVALKVASVPSADAHARLRREAQHASRLSHPNICHIYDVGRDGEQLFVVMELIEGRSLADLLREGPLPIARAQRYGAEIADALAHAHERGLMHRDLKGTNVMITARGAKVLDFGLARMIDTQQIDVLSHSQRSLTGEGMIAGTLPYMAPELLRGERGDQRADIWALGVLLYEMVGGRRPFAGATGFELSAAILHQPPETLPSSVPARLAAVIERCLAKDAGARFQQAAEVHAALVESHDTPRRFAPMRIPRMAMRVVLGLLLLAVAGVVAGWVAQQVGTRLASTTTFSNSRGYSLLQEGQFDRAVAEFEGVTEREPDDANAWDSLGEGYLASGMAEQAAGAYSRALSIDPAYEASLLGRGIALAALGRYDEALQNESPDFPIQAFLLSRVGRYGEAAAVLDSGRRAAKNDPESMAGALVMSSWLSLERGEGLRALVELRAAGAVLEQVAGEPDHALLIVADLLGGVAEIRGGNVDAAKTRYESQRLRHDGDDRVESNWVAALQAEIALAERRYDDALAGFTAAARPAWPTLGRSTLAVFAANHPSRDGRARVELARGNRAAAIREYRRLTTVGNGERSSGVLEPRHVLALARLLGDAGDAAGARVEYGRFLQLWTNADEGLPEIDEARRGAGLSVPPRVPPPDLPRPPS